MAHYIRFAMMIIVSTLVMYGLMYLNTFQLNHIFFSETRVYMALIMGASMALVMLAFMRQMYTHKTLNGLIAGVSVGIFVVALWLVRSQTTVDDIAYMRAMIPHHSIAVLTSSRAQISDPRVRMLADGIINTQLHEIDEMKSLISDLENKQEANSQPN